MEMSPRNLAVIDHPTARLVLNILVSVIGLAIGIWLMSGATDNLPDTPMTLMCGAFLVAASVVLLNSSIRFFLKYRK
jgi:hypothetical protein